MRSHSIDRRSAAINCLTHRAPIAWAVVPAFILLVHGVVIGAIVHRVPIWVRDTTPARIPPLAKLRGVGPTKHVAVVDTSPHIESLGERRCKPLISPGIQWVLARQDRQHTTTGDHDCPGRAFHRERGAIEINGRSRLRRRLYEPRIEIAGRTWERPKTRLKQNIIRWSSSEISNRNLKRDLRTYLYNWVGNRVQPHPSPLIQFEGFMCFGKLARRGVRSPLLLNGLILHLLQSSIELCPALVNRRLCLAVRVTCSFGSLAGSVGGTSSGLRLIDGDRDASDTARQQTNGSYSERAIEFKLPAFIFLLLAFLLFCSMLQCIKSALDIDGRVRWRWCIASFGSWLGCQAAVYHVITSILGKV